MKTRKVQIIVLTFTLSLIFIFSCIFFIKKINYSVKYCINYKNTVESFVNVGSTILTKDKQTRINTNSSGVTSRSGKHTPLAVTENAETNKPEEKIKPMYEGIELEYSAAYNISSSRLSKSKGVTYYNGHKETYYSQRVLSGKGLKMLNNNGRHVANDGTVRDGDGYIAVACNYLPKGSRIMTSLGPGKVYDTGGMTGKWIDIYVNW